LFITVGGVLYGLGGVNRTACFEIGRDDSGASHVYHEAVYQETIIPSDMQS